VREQNKDGRKAMEPSGGPTGCDPEVSTAVRTDGCPHEPGPTQVPCILVQQDKDAIKFTTMVNGNSKTKL
jgi:hypothetical protein